MQGFSILKQSFRLVFGNLSQSVRLSSPILIVLIAAFAIYGPDYLLGEFNPNSPNSLPASALFFHFLTAVAGLWVAVAWHRFVLLEEFPEGVLPAFHGRLMLGYFGYGLLMGLLVGLTTFAVGFLIGFALFWAPVLMTIGVIAVVVWGFWIFYRLSPILPGHAIGKSIRFKEAWTATKPLSWAILSAMVFFVGSFIALGVAGAFVATLIPLLGGAIILAINWLYAVVGVSFLTTLYGVAVEGRSID
ncbi:MAG: hypothetical protein JJ868_05715 [Shimia sp.]|uniref:hypothetical protein n=1 Tax=Shimia sp. TaxID=1954381 RepID=UPI0019E08897|nr:hypothetical protein [Shimia sp.]MBE1294062.1 hypothetical protein [Paracoccaceae bacterium]MBO6896849.1 hypothetical protein [Shimia sp.]